MKNTIICLLTISFLLEGCYSYKIIDLKKTPLIEGKTYKYNTKQNKKHEKITLKSFDNNIMNAKIGRKEKQITINDIKSIKVRKISELKTIVLIPIIIIPTVLIGTGFKLGGYYSPQGNSNPP